MIRPEIFREMEPLLRGEDAMLGRQILGLEEKMKQMKTRPGKELARHAVQRWENDKREFQKLLSDFGLVQLPNGQVISRDARVDKGSVAECAFVAKFLNFETESLNKFCGLAVS